MTSTETVTPTAQWGTRPLLRAHAAQPTAATAALLMQRLQDWHDAFLNPEERSCFIAYTGSGHWARGATLKAAAKALLAQGARRRDSVGACFVLNDPAAELNGYGGLLTAPPAASVSLGVLGTVGSVLGR